MKESEIFLSSLRQESFGLAAAEAGECGCTTHYPKPLRQVTSFIKCSCDDLSGPDTSHCFNVTHEMWELNPDTISENILRII